MMKLNIINIFIRRTAFGMAGINELPTVDIAFGAKKTPIVTDQFIAGSGFLRMITEPLDAANIFDSLFHKCGVEASLSIIEELVAKVVPESIDFLIGTINEANVRSEKRLQKGLLMMGSILYFLICILQIFVRPTDVAGKKVNLRITAHNKLKD